jgi:aspartate-semialdehyde dehydrogenase
MKKETPVFKIAIAGASSLLGRELKDVLSESPLAGSSFALLDEEEAQGKLEQVGDEVTFIQAMSAEAFERADFTFFCGTERLTLSHWRQALAAGSTVFDLSGALDRQEGVLVRAPWLGTGRAPVDLLTPAVVPAHPAAVVLALLMERLERCGAMRFAAATVLEPASEFGRAAIDELHQQTVNLLNFQSLPRTIYDAQVAYNLLGGFGEASPINLGAAAARIRRHYDGLAAGRWPTLTLQVIHAPVFHGHAFSVAIEFEVATAIKALEEALSGEHVELVAEDADSPSNLAATGQNDLLVRLHPEFGAGPSGTVKRLWLWAASDNLRWHAQNAVACAFEMRPLRPQGSVQ